jgi:predicted O-methyltransferase YrrM
VPLGYRLLLFSLVRELKPKTLLELGTAAGYSALYMGIALKLNEGEGETGILYTCEGDQESYQAASERFSGLPVYRKLADFDAFLDDLVPCVGPLDFAFVDGPHTGYDEVRYAAKISRYRAPDGIVVYDDIRWSTVMSEAWKEIRQSPDVAASVDFGKMGLVILSEESQTPFHWNAQERRGKFGAVKR